jgi:hypothetical protein
MFQTTTLPRPPRTLPGPQPGSETNVEGGGSSRAVTRLHTVIGLTGYRTHEATTFYVLGVRFTGAPKKHS